MPSISFHDEPNTCHSSKDTIIRVWNRETFELVRTLRGHEGPVNAVCSEGGKLVSASGDGKLILWDIQTGERLRTLEGHDRGLACIEFRVRLLLWSTWNFINSLSQSGLIISGSNDCKIKIWSAETGECLRTLTGHGALVRALAFDPANGRLASASYDKSIRLWDVSTGMFHSSLSNPLPYVSISPRSSPERIQEQSYQSYLRRQI